MILEKQGVGAPKIPWSNSVSDVVQHPGRVELKVHCESSN